MARALTFGARYRTLITAVERLELDEAEGRRAAFAQVDTTLDRLLLAALHGERIISADGTLTVTETERLGLVEQFSLARQHERGAWYEPKLTDLATGHIHLIHWWQQSPRHALSLASGRMVAASRSNAAKQKNTDLVVIWAALEPIFEDLALPLMLRSGRMAGQKTTAKQVPYWTKTIEPVYEALGAGMDAVRKYLPGTGWGELDAAEAIARRDALLASWEQADLATVRRLRAHRIGQLVEHYYSKAKNGRAARKHVINNDGFERTLTAYFGGDWLAFLSYLGEEPDVGEEITTSLPNTRLTGTSSQRAAEVAAGHGLTPEEVERMLAAYWGQTGGGTPIERRVHVLESLWHQFDAVHARQAPGMPSLHGLMGSGYVSSSGPAGSSAGDARVFSPELLTDVQRLWGTKLSARNPERLVTDLYWMAATARTLGPAFDAWQYTAMNAWEMTEGGRAHSDLEGFEQHVGWPLARLAATGFPADRQLFADLLAAESELGPIEQGWETVEEDQEGFLTFQMRVSRGTGRKGFEILRDIITRHRRAWAKENLTSYLEARWKGELAAVGEAYHRHAADKGKPPTVKQFAAIAADAADHWFGGDLTGVYGALGLRSPLPSPTYTRLVPQNPRAFTRRVKQELIAITGPAQGDKLTMLARHSIRWLELAEALGAPPTLKQLGTRHFTFAASVLDADVDAAWQMYSEVIERALAADGTAPSRPAVPTSSSNTRPSGQEPDPVAPAPSLTGAPATVGATKPVDVEPPTREHRGLWHRPWRAS